ncbi:hypothetical protein [Marinimicrobium sp. C2-29]|uniref:hypothetical protein n=1 Tax=Marinimicrobium sp. C2-29 TaxID=3139825 RepID=UPI003139358C
MDDASRLYLSGMGMINALGGSAPMVWAAAGAGINRYTLSRFVDDNGDPIRLAPVPDAVFDQPGWEIDEGDQYSEPQDHAIKMALHALAQITEQGALPAQAPLVLAMNEPELEADCLPLDKLKANLALSGHAWLNPELLRSLHSGRAAGIEAMEFAYDYLADVYPDGMVIGASDSPNNYTRLRVPEQQNRLMTLGPTDGYVPGEGAAFIVLTAEPRKAMVEDGKVLVVHPPGLAQEPGDWFSDEPYLGEGLDAAFKAVLEHYAGPPIHSIYSSMNGERYWAKEYGVAMIRSQKRLGDAHLVHPAEYYGDLGSATAPSLMALAAFDLLNNPNADAHLVYSSSDTGLRGALILEKRDLARERTEGGAI